MKITSKNTIDTTISGLITEFNSKPPNYLKQSYNVGHQQRAVSEMKKNLEIDESFSVIDFSQNYGYKYAKEIQSVHFGASKKHICLHTGAFFYKDKITNEIRCVSFCTVSENSQHDAPAIWAHMQPIFELIKSKVPDLRVMHFQSDGPTTQYKNKSNVYICFNFFATSLIWNMLPGTFPLPVMVRAVLMKLEVLLKGKIEL